MAISAQEGAGGPGLGDTPEAEAGPTEDELFDLLANRRRRYTLHALTRDGTDQAELGDLAEQVAAWETEKTVEEVTSAERKRVYTALQQSHLPKMDDAGVVVFEKDRGTVEPTPAVEDLDIYMDVVHGRDLPWNQYYLLLAGLGGALLAALVTDTAPVTVLPDVAWFAFIVVALAVSALAHTVLASRMQVGGSDRPPGAQ